MSVKDFLEKYKIDLSDPKMKRNVILIGVLLIGFLLLIIVGSISPEKKKTPDLLVQEPGREMEKSALLEIPEGEDRDVLDEPNMVALLERNRKNNQLKNLYEASASENTEDPMAIPDKKEISSGQQASDDTGLSLKQRLGLEPIPQAEPEEEPHQIAPATGMKPVPTYQSPRQNINPEDISHEPLDDIPAPASEEPEVATPAPVRKTGGISSLDEWGTIDGISGLDSEDQYVTIDASKPVRVMFVKEQKITSGQRITLRLLDDIAADGILIPKNTHLSAQCTLGERIDIKVNNIEINGKILNLGYTAYDNDGNEGLYCPESNSKKTTQQATSQATNITTQLLSQALSGVASNVVQAGTQMVQSTKGVKSAQISAGYTFYLLKDDY